MRRTIVLKSYLTHPTNGKAGSGVVAVTITMIFRVEQGRYRHSLGPPGLLPEIIPCG